MASLSPQRSRRPQTQQQQVTQAAMLNHPARETSPSPSLRERTRASKTQSMPMGPPTNMYLAQQGSQNQQQSSPTIPTTGARRSPPLGAVTRLLPTPPHPNPPFNDDRRPSPPPRPQQSHSQPNVNAHYPRPSPRAPTASYPNKLHHLEEYLEMTPELLADIERADQQQYQSAQPSHPYSYSPGARGDSPPSGKGVNNDRGRGPPERTSPTNPDNGNGQQRGWRDQQQQQQQQQASRESPKASSASPNVVPFTQGQGQSHTPERRSSPAGHVPVVIPGEPHPASYLAQFANRDPSIMRRAPNPEQRLGVSMASQTPPLQNIPTRTPNRSLPVQEEDEVAAKNNGNGHPNWQVNDQSAGQQQFDSSSPTLSSDLDPDINGQRYDTAASHNNHREEDKPVHKHEDSRAQYTDRDSNDEDATYTPRSPVAGLPENDREAYYTKNSGLIAPRAKPRNGSTDHVMIGVESALQEQEPSPTDNVSPQQAQPTERTAQFTERLQTNGDQHQKQEYAYAQYTQERLQNLNNGQYQPPQVYPDDFQSYGEDSTSAYIRAYLHSPRPDAPIPPTPHSQTGAPSPSPLLSAYGLGNDASSYRMRAAGSPYPFPFSHVRRNRQTPGRFLGNGFDQQRSITDQIARQWQVYAQNNQGNITDSTLSPRATPFQADDLYHHWAYLHTQKTLGAGLAGLADTASIQSSPSHQPIPLPSFVSGKKKERGYQTKRRSYDRKPPPRVESTQPRETSPELSSSGEETSTAGEERPTSVAVDQTATATAPLLPAAPLTVDIDDNGEWVDEDEDDDYEDLLDLEYHPAFVKNISKRRRKWEVGWENLIQAFQALDRQTDATMILLASPSHTTKLHALRSRSIRRQPLLSGSKSMNQIRSGFSHVAAQRRSTRPDKSSLVDRLMLSSSSSNGDGSDGSSGSVEENLRRALDVALGSLGAMGEVYEQREMRVMEELQRAREEREKVELLLKQVLGEKLQPLNNPHLPRSAS